MNLLSLIIIFIAVVICAAIAFIAWELTREAGRERPVNRPEPPPGGAGDGEPPDTAAR